jgi:hypothetical protein
MVGTYGCVIIQCEVQCELTVVCTLRPVSCLFALASRGRGFAPLTPCNIPGGGKGGRRHRNGRLYAPRVGTRRKRKWAGRDGGKFVFETWAGKSTEGRGGSRGEGGLRAQAGMGSAAWMGAGTFPEMCGARGEGGCEVDRGRARAKRGGAARRAQRCALRARRHARRARQSHPSATAMARGGAV